MFLHVRDPQRDRTLGQPHQHLTTSRSTYAQPGDVREGLPLPQVPAAQQPVLLQHMKTKKARSCTARAAQRSTQVRKGQLEATATKTNNAERTADTTKATPKRTRARSKRHAREGSLRERQQNTTSTPRGLPQTMDAKERRTVGRSVKLQDRTDPSTLRTYHLAKPTRKPTTPRSQPPSQRSTRPCTSNHEPKQRQSKRSARATASSL